MTKNTTIVDVLPDEATQKEQPDNQDSRLQARLAAHERLIKCWDSLESLPPCKRTPTLRDVDAVVRETLNLLDMEIYSLEREEFGNNIYYTVYKEGEFLGVYEISPGSPGGSIQCASDPELSAEWYNLFNIVWITLQMKFGRFPWPKKRVSD